MKIRIDHNLDKEFLLHGLYKYLDFEDFDSGKPNKSEFMAFVRENVTLYGSDTGSCWGMYCEIHPECCELYAKWFTDKQ